MTKILVITWTLFLILLPLQSNAATLRVPEEYSTIQSALDSTQAWDTVLVAPGTYNEFLVGPEHSFVLSGVNPPDSGAILQTLLDPIPPPEADTPSVVIVSSDTVVIKNFAFFNRPDLRQPVAPDRAGGIENNAALLRVENCRFDSVSYAIEGGLNLVVSNCTFSGCIGICITPDIGGRQITTDSFFETNGYVLDYVASNSRIENCVFSCNTAGALLLILQGSNIVVRGCRFGPCVGGFSAIEVSPISGIVIENNLFEGIDRIYDVITIGTFCDRIHGVPVTIVGNTFRDNNTIGLTSGVLSVNFNCAQEGEGYLGVVHNNTFINCSSNILTPGINSRNSSIDITDNTFINLEPATLPDIYAQGRSQDTIIARDNALYPPGLGASRTNSYFDARENWWGDSTGPYNINENPDGQGAEVANGVLFIPWLTQHPDSTTDTTHISIDEPADIQLSNFSLATFPNPFNSTVTIEYSLAHEQKVTLVIYDLLGRQVETLLDERQGIGVHTIKWNADRYASGLYFARLSSGESSFSTQAVKLLLMK